MIGQTLSHYRITGKLGAGGMGEVYKAHDERLGRDVAIKVLRKDLASNPERLHRFEQEARAASALNHPNIITIHDIGKHEGAPYIAMEYVEGKTVRELVSEGPLPTERLLRLATQIAEGLAKAHTAGIIHRDLKPENLMVTTDGYVKILDFGLAKLLPQPGLDSEAATITKEGTVAGAVMGTARYMSPEQALGKPLDTRTDVFSLGAVLYEMATGKRPFHGETPAALFEEILHKTPAPPSTLNPDWPQRFDRLIERALEKDHARRYPSANEVLQDIRAVDTGSLSGPQAETKSIVVLPFEDISPGRDNEYFADGLTEEIISDLSAIRSLRVVSRTSAMRYKGTDKDIGAIGKDLNVRYVLEGSVRKAGNNLRITAQLIDAPTDAHVWAKKFTGTLDDVFEIQETVSRAIVDSLQTELSPKEEARIADRPIPNVYAYECLLKARYEIAKWTEEGFDNALKHLQNGLDIVGENAVLSAMLGYVYFSYINVGLGRYEDYRQKAEESARKALELDPESPYGHLVLGHLQVWCESLTGGIRHLKRALAADPGNFDALFWLTIIYCLEGRADDAFAHADRIKKLEPLNAVNGSLPGCIHGFVGRFDLALELLQKGLETHPDDFFTRWWYGTALAWNHRYEEAASVFEGIAQDDPNSLLPKVMLALAWSLLGRNSVATPILERPEIEAWARRDFNCALFVAECFAPLGETEKALDWLEHAVDIGFINYPFLVRHDPFLENIRGEDRFKKLMERVKIEWEHFEA